MGVNKSDDHNDPTNGDTIFWLYVERDGHIHVESESKDPEWLMEIMTKIMSYLLNTPPSFERE